MRNSTPKISVSIPIYNCEKYISKCAQSLLEQSYPNIEYIFVDDASVDNSLTILNRVIEHYPQRKEQIKVISLAVNGGSSHARTIGLDNMTGEYFIFCDADDWVEPDAYAQMMELMQRNNSDIVCTPFYIDKEGKTTPQLFNTDRFIGLNNIPIDTLYFSLCNKLIRRSLIIEHKIKPLEGVNCWEDLSMVAKLYALTNHITIHDTPFYHYNKQESNTLTGSNHKRILDDHLICTDQLIEWFSANGLDKNYDQFLNTLKFTAKIKMLRGTPREYRRWRETYPETNRGILSRYPHIPLSYRILFYIVAINSTP
ncbi:MAG: glycosyltransferase family 2 protein [Bacteroidales bacterium]